MGQGMLMRLSVTQEQPADEPEFPSKSTCSRCEVLMLVDLISEQRACDWLLLERIADLDNEVTEQKRLFLSHQVSFDGAKSEKEYKKPRSWRKCNLNNHANMELPAHKRRWVHMIGAVVRKLSVMRQAQCPVPLPALARTPACVILHVLSTCSLLS